MDRLLQDIRYALRALARSPGFTAVALLTIALGIGANAAMFSIVNGVLLRPLPYTQPDDLVLLYHSNPRTGEMEGGISYQDLQDWRARTRSLTTVAGFASVPTILTGRGEPIEFEMSYVTEEFFNVLGLPTAYGRPLLQEDFRLQQRHAVISDGLWRGILGADPAAIGNSILLRGEPFTVVGVMPPTMGHPTPETRVWIPQSLVEDNMFSTGPPTRKDRYLSAVGRLAPGADAAQAQRELTAISQDLAATYPESNEDWTAAAAVPLHSAVVGDVDQALLIILIVVGFILLIGCANLANLLLARGSARSREIAIRTALGAGRMRIVRQLLTESLVLALLGGVLGLLLSFWGVQTILGLSADTLPRVDDVRIDARVIGFGLLLTLGTGLLFGLLPALRIASTDPQKQLRGGRGTLGSGTQRLRSTLVIAEVTLAVVLVIGAGLMARSFLELRSVDPGFDAERVLTVTMQLNFAGIPEEEIGSFLVSRREEIIERVGAVPGVVEVGMINAFPLRDEGFEHEYARADGRDAQSTAPVRAETRYVSPDYIRAMGIPLQRGEPLPEQVTPGAPIPMLISESAARRYWPGEDPVGRVLDAGWAEVVVTGVVGDVRQLGLTREASPAVYLPQLVAPRIMATLAVRTAGDPAALAAPIRQAIQELDPNQPIRSISPLRGVMSESIARDRFFTVLFAVFGGLALVLAGVGIYGVLAYSVTQRIHEIGLRMALGAQAGNVLRLVVGGGMLLVGAGVVLGTVAALLLTRVLEAQLYGISTTDPIAFAAALGFLVAVALLASYVPAHRATRVDPMIALRGE
jgi:predicted permease